MKDCYHIIALVSACIGSFFASSGLILMKVAYIKNEKETDGKYNIQKYYFRTEWLLGALCIVFNVAFNGCK